MTEENKILIAFFSRKGNNYMNGRIKNLPVGNTEAVAGKIQKLTSGDLFKIDTVSAYPEDYDETARIAKQELNKNARPKLKKYPPAISDYDIIILGYPNWWGTMPMSVFTFLESADTSGKIIIPYCTHEGSGMGRSEADIKTLCPDAKVYNGLALRGSSVNTSDELLRIWLKKLEVIS